MDGGDEDVDALGDVDLTGWWLAPKIGAKEAWLYHDDIKAMRPPETGWTLGGMSNAGFPWGSNSPGGAGARLG